MLTERSIAVSVIALPLLVAVIERILYLRKIAEKKERLADFFYSFDAWVKSRGEDTNAYHKMLRLQERVQIESLGYGYFSRYHIPGTQLVATNYQIFANIPSAIQRIFARRGLYMGEEEIENLYSDLHSASVRYESGLVEARKSALKELVNPIRLYAIGFRKILSIPLEVLGELGLIGTSFIGGVTSSWVFRAVGAIAGILSAVASILTIIIGWPEVSGLIGTLIPIP